MIGTLHIVYIKYFIGSDKRFSSLTFILSFCQCVNLVLERFQTYYHEAKITDVLLFGVIITKAFYDLSQKFTTDNIFKS